MGADADAANGAHDQAAGDDVTEDQEALVEQTLRALVDLPDAFACQHVMLTICFNLWCMTRWDTGRSSQQGAAANWSRRPRCIPSQWATHEAARRDVARDRSGCRKLCPPVRYESRAKT